MLCCILSHCEYDHDGDLTLGLPTGVFREVRESGQLPGWEERHCYALDPLAPWRLHLNLTSRRSEQSTHDW